MPTHQSLSGATDQEFLQRMVDTHPERFGPPYWTFFDGHVRPLLPARAVMLDLGCGPGLFLRDLAERYPDASLHGYDLTPAMIEYGRSVPRRGAALILNLLDVATQPLPHTRHSVDLLSMSSVLHVLDEPLPVLAEIRRVLAPKGVFLLNDWVRQSLPAYLAWRRESMKEDESECLRRGYRLFGVHNKYTPEDWRWLLAAAGFSIRAETSIRDSHRIFVATPSADAATKNRS